MAGQPQNTNSNAIPEIGVREAYDRLTANEGEGQTALVDVREVWEFQEGHASGATNVPLSQLVQRVNEIPRDREVLLICHLGSRSMEAAKFLRRQGIERVVNIDGGTDAWESAGLPMRRGDAD